MRSLPPGGMVLPPGTPQTLDLNSLPLEALWQEFGIFKQGGAYPLGYPQNVRRLFAPVDEVHKAIVAFCRAARLSIAGGMYGWDDDEVDALFREKLDTEHIPVQLSLDSSQAGGVHERKILAQWNADQIGNSVAIGRSSKGAISHVKLIVIDGIITIQGSTNLSDSGESKQNNECTFVMDPVFAAETRARLDIIHDEMLTQMKAVKK